MEKINCWWGLIDKKAPYLDLIIVSSNFYLNIKVQSRNIGQWFKK